MHQVTIVVLFAIGTLSFGSDANHEVVNNPLDDVSDKNEKPKPRRCCLPPRYEGRAGIHSDVDMKTQGMFNVDIFMPHYAADIKHQLYAIDEIIFTKYGRQNVTTILDIKKNIAYVFNRETKTCKRAPIPPGMDASSCIPDAAEFLGPVALGAGRHALRCDAWKVTKSSQSPITYNLTATFLMQPDGCIPVMEMINGYTNGTRTVSFITFMDIHPYIRDPKVFDVPSYCEKAADTHISDISEMAKHVLSKLR